MKFSIKGFFSECDQIRSSLRIWANLLKKSLMGNCMFCALLNSNLLHLHRIYLGKFIQEFVLDRRGK